MSKLKVGNRVRVYGRPSPGCGISPWSGVVVEQDKGPHEGDSISVKAEFGGKVFDVHPKQCRKLKKKEKPLSVEFETKLYQATETTARIIETDEVTKKLYEFYKSNRRVRVTVTELK
jgi:hypothetical protein